MPESIHTVFISSTYEDLREERAEVQKAVLRLGCMPIGMELFPSADDDAWGYITEQIEQSDYYILIVGGKYGSTDQHGISFTEKEYRLAKSLRKPILVFVRSQHQPVAEDKREQDDKKRTKLRSFVSELNDVRLAQRFDSFQNLALLAYQSLHHLRSSRPTVGYVRPAQVNGDNEKGRSENISVQQLKKPLLSHTFLLRPERYDEIVIKDTACTPTSCDIKLGYLFVLTALFFSLKPTGNVATNFAEDLYDFLSIAICAKLYPEWLDEPTSSFQSCLAGRLRQVKFLQILEDTGLLNYVRDEELAWYEISKRALNDLPALRERYKRPRD